MKTVSSVSQVLVSKSNSQEPEIEKIIERKCKIVDVYIIEWFPPGTLEYESKISGIVRDIYDDTILTININKSDFTSLGYEISNRDLIDICTALKMQGGVFKIMVPETSSEITISSLMDKISNQSGENTKKKNTPLKATKEIDLLKNSDTKTTKTIDVKFGRK